MPVPVGAESGEGGNRTPTKVRSLLQSSHTLTLSRVFVVKYVTVYLLHQQNTELHRIADDSTPISKSQIGARGPAEVFGRAVVQSEPANTKVKLTQISLISNDPRQIDEQHIDNSFLHIKN